MKKKQSAEKNTWSGHAPPPEGTTINILEQFELIVMPTNFHSSHEQYQCGLTSTMILSIMQFDAQLKENTYQ